MPKIDAAGDAIRSLAKRQPLPSFEMFHGSPHDFSKFDWSKLGSGEGHAAYGLGFYGAESPAVALRPSGYAHRLSMNDVAKRVVNEAAGDRVDVDDWRDIRDTLYESAITDPKQQEFLDALTENDWLGYDDLRQVVYDLRQNPLSSWEANKRLKDAHANLGYNYKLRVNADQNHMLDWDTDLLLQHPHVVENVVPELEKRGIQYRASDDDDTGMSGRRIYKDAVDALGGKNKTGLSAASAMLRDAGVPGIKYLDGQSRRAGDGTRNYVIFDDSLIDILKKWSAVPPIAAGALSGLSEDR